MPYIICINSHVKIFNVIKQVTYISFKKAVKAVYVHEGNQ